MLFNSLQFLLFFPAVTVLYFAVRQRWRVPLLLIASCGFYMAAIPAYILVLFAIILVDYGCAFRIAAAGGIRRRAWLLASLAANIGLLVVFKYYDFGAANLERFAHMVGWNYSLPHLALILPLGLSFHTFQAMSYTIEVYRERQAPERSLPHYALYVLFYPQLVAGPIERPQHLLPQLHAPRGFDYGCVVEGLRLMGWGLFKKAAIADRLAVSVNEVYAAPGSFNGGVLAFATAAFAFQIYCDFSGYTDIARGAARVMGFDLMENFRRPYFAQSIGEFWRRWHISLSTWFRDYVYFPLGGSRGGLGRTCANLSVVFLISGLWHGASWTFLAWGALHGVYRLVEVLAERADVFRTAPSTGVTAALRVSGVFVLVSVAWVFFRAADITTASSIVRRMLILSPTGMGVTGLAIDGYDAFLTLLGLAVLVVVEGAQEWRQGEIAFAGLPVWKRWAVYYGLALGIMALGVFTKSPFIYFQF